MARKARLSFLFAIMMLALLFAVGLAIDAASSTRPKRTEQEAADAAAFAGAVVPLSAGNWRTGHHGSRAPDARPTDTSAAAGAPCRLPGCATNVATQTTVAVYWPPISGTYIGNIKHVEVAITRQVKNLARAGPGRVQPGARARRRRGEPLNNGYAIMALDRGNTCTAFETSDNGDVHLTGGGILVNSTCSTAASNDQNTAARFTIQSPYPLDVNGGATGHWADLGIPVNPGHNQIPDPFAGFPKPATTGLPVCNSLAACQDGSGNQNPGIYTVNFGGNGNSDMVMNPGIYILKHGMDTGGNNAITGNNVFIYNTYSTYPAAPGGSRTAMRSTCRQRGEHALRQTTGTWSNLLVYQDPACSTTMRIGGNGTFIGTGSVYIPSAGSASRQPLDAQR